MVKVVSKSPRLYQQVAERIVDLIEDENYSIGMRLPAERELASMFNVSRPTVREAIIALEIKNYVEVRIGSGVYVLLNQSSEGHSIDEDIGPFELTEARALFEGEAAALAATMISDEELTQLAEILDEMANENENNVTSHEAADKTFHMHIAKATQNSAIVPIIQGLWEMRESSPLSRRMYQRSRNSGVKPSVEEHREIYNALKAHDAKTARTAMRSHLMRVIESILEATEIDAIEAARTSVNKNRKRFNLARSIG